MDAEIAFIGEAPGQREDKQGLPFRGPAGQYFDSLLRSIGVKREKVWVSNTTKCRPLKNRTPTAEEVELCASRWLDVELQMVRPRIIVPMGDAAITHFLGEGTVYERHGVPTSRSRNGRGWQGPGIHSVSDEEGEQSGNGGVESTPDDHNGERFLFSDGQTSSDRGAPIILPIYHPAAGLHRPELMIAIQEDFLVLKGVIEGSWEPVVDQYPEPVYMDCSELALPGEDDGRLLALDSEWVNGKLWSVQVSDAPGQGFFHKTAPAWLSNVVVHNYLADAQFVDLPRNTRDTMLMAYLLGLPQGLKELAKRLCGMDMDSYEDMVGRYGKEKAMAYLERAAQGYILGEDGNPERGWVVEVHTETGEVRKRVAYGEDWPDPPVLEDFTWDKKTNTLGVKQKTPQHISKKIKRILSDVKAGKVNKNGPVDPYTRWHGIDSREREMVKERLGPMPDGNLGDAPLEDAVRYSCRDADATLRVDGVLWPLILEKGLSTVFQMDMGTYPVALEMMKNGIKIDPEKLRGLADRFAGMMQSQAEAIFIEAHNSLMGKPDYHEYGFWRFNPNSDNELRRLFFGRLGFKPTKLTKTGLPSVAGEELAKIDHPLVKMVEEYRHVQHLKDSFCDTLPGKADSGGRVHPTIRTTRTATGRWSMADPNCQQIPVRTDLGREIRKAFIAEEGNLLIAIDYSQIELRVASHLSQCQSMMQAFKEGRDIHSETAMRLFGVEEPTSQQRYAAKTLNFGVIYGITADGFQAQMEVEGQRWTVEDCSQFIKESQALRPELWVWQEETKAFARRNGYVMDMFGRRRLLPEILCPVKWIQSSGDREAINMPVQAGAQGIIKLAMRKLDEEQSSLLPPCTWLLQIHDELLWEVNQGDVPSFVDWAIPIMENVVQLSVPVIAEAKVGLNWGEMEKWTA